MSFKENSYQQMSFTDIFSRLTAREQKTLENSLSKAFADATKSLVRSSSKSFLVILMMRWLKILCWIFGFSMPCIQQVLKNSL